MRFRQYICFFLIFCVNMLIAISANGQLRINEFMASNATEVVDPDFGENADWVEIYNAGYAPADLSGYYLTDNLSNPDKWQIPSKTIIPSKGFLLIWTDGMDTLLHASFKLAMEGEEIGLVSPGLTLIDSVRFIHQSTDISYGRKP